MENRKPLLRVGPDSGCFTETGGGSETREAFQGVLVGKLRDDFFAAGKMKVQAAHPARGCRSSSRENRQQRDPVFAAAWVIAIPAGNRRRPEGFRARAWRGLIRPPNRAGSASKCRRARRRSGSGDVRAASAF